MTALAELLERVPSIHVSYDVDTQLWDVETADHVVIGHGLTLSAAFEDGICRTRATDEAE